MKPPRDGPEDWETAINVVEDRINGRRLDLARVRRHRREGRMPRLPEPDLGLTSATVSTSLCAGRGRAMSFHWGEEAPRGIRALSHDGEHQVASHEKNQRKKVAATAQLTST